MERKVAIVGAGLSGLIACKYVVSKGYTPIVFEAKGSLGGVWIKTLETTKLQTVKQAYQFTDFPWPEHVPACFPDHDQVLEYIEAYARHFDLTRHVRFNTKVVSIAYEGVGEEEIEAWGAWGGTGEAFSNKGKWNVTVENSDTSSSEEHQVDFVILCVGRFSDVPNLPEFPQGEGPEAFRGEATHANKYVSMDYEKAADYVKGKRVAVVGFHKSALDLAAECAAVNGKEYPCTVLYRTPHWFLPDMQPWGISLASLYLNRFAELQIRKPGQGFLLSILSTLLAPVRWSVSKLVESHIKRKLSLEKHGIVPKESFLEHLSSCITCVVPDNFFENVEQGSIVLKRADKFRFCKEGVVANGDVEPVELDLVLFATGFQGEQKLRDIFASKRFGELILGSPSAIAPLYRQCVHPRIPQLAVIGFSESIANLYTSEMRCRWLAEFLDGTFKLPSIPKMEKEIKEWDEYIKSYSRDYYRKSCIAALHIWYNDQLCKDIGINPKRKKGFLAELFEPYGPQDYAQSQPSKHS